MNEDRAFETAWRELLITRLKSVQTVLKRDSTAEQKRLREAKIMAAGYGSYEEAHEAYGWDCITLKQLDAIKAIFDASDKNKPQEALKRLNWIIGILQGEINTLLYGDEAELKIERYFEELAWREAQDD